MGFWGNDLFFKQDDATLLQNRNLLEYLLRDVWKRSDSTIALYLEAYDYFCKNKDSFDGASIVGDFYFIPNLDIWAMLHDYLYIVYKVACNYKYKFYVDWIYCSEMRRFKIHWKDVWITRFLGLTIALGATFTPYRFFSGLRMNLEDKKTVGKIYSRLK